MAKKKQVYRNDVYIGLEQPVRVLFPPKLTEPQQINGEGKPKYEVPIGFPADHPDYLRLYTLFQEMAEEKNADWGLEVVELDNTVESKFVDGNEEYKFYAEHKDEEKRREYPQLKDLIVMKLRSVKPITVFDARYRDDEGIPIAITDKESIKNLIYGGCYVSMRLTLQTYDPISPRTNPNPGVTAYPEQVCFVVDGDRLGGGNDNSGQGFAQVQGAVSAEDPTGGD